ncbi:MAG: META domain-containing protein [Patescibacteria group bacterium]
MKNIVMIIVVLLVGVGLVYYFGENKTGDNKEGEDLQSSIAPLYAYVWQWQESRLDGGEIVRASDPSQFELRFLEDNRFTSSTDCNIFTGNYAIENGTELGLSEIASTKMACPEESLEQDYANLLALTESFTVTTPEGEESEEPMLELNQENSKMIFIGVAQ